VQKTAKVHFWFFLVGTEPALAEEKNLNVKGAKKRQKFTFGFCLH
jgi:hypothetical protein